MPLNQVSTSKILIEVADAVASITSSRHQNEVLNLILEKAINLTNAHNGRIRLIDNKREYFLGGVSKGYPSEYEGIKRKIGEGISGEVVLTGDILDIPDITKYPKFTKVLDQTEGEYREYLATIKSVIGAPLMIKGRIIGALTIHNREKTHAFTDSHRQILFFLAKQAAIAVENAMLFDALQKLASAVSISHTDEQTVLQSIAMIVCDLLNVPACSVWILDKESGQFRIKASIGLKDSYVNRASLEITDNITGEAFKSQKPVQVEDIEKESRLKYPNELLELGLKSLLAFPLFIRDEGIGTINVYTTYQHNFTSAEINLLETFAIQARIVIERSHVNRCVKSIRRPSFQVPLFQAL
jgi:GAF domain-containing protein